jgi:hypothetical protein
LRQVDVLEEIEEEDVSIGRARERINAAIKSVEAFLKQHHNQVQRERAEAQAAEAAEDRADRTDTPAFPGGDTGAGGAPGDSPDE